jgi:hypothetical protein
MASRILRRRPPQRLALSRIPGTFIVRAIYMIGVKQPKQFWVTAITRMKKKIDT